LEPSKLRSAARVKDKFAFYFSAGGGFLFIESGDRHHPKFVEYINSDSTPSILNNPYTISINLVI